MFPNIFPDAWPSSSIVCFIYTHTHTNLCLMHCCHVCAQNQQCFGVIKSGIIGHKFLRFQRKANVSLHCNLVYEAGHWNVCVVGTEGNVSKPNVLKPLHACNKISYYKNKQKQTKKKTIHCVHALLLLWFGYLVTDLRYGTSDVLFKGY